MARMTRGVAAGAASLMKAVLGLALTAAMLGLAGAGVLAWRLAQGPLDVTGLVEAAQRWRGGAAPPVTAERATIAWSGFTDGAASALELRLHGLHLAGAAGARSGASVARADVTLVALPLLTGTVEPRRIVLDEVVLNLLRDRDGSVRLDLETGDPSAGGSDILAELRRSPGSPDSDPSLSALQQLVVSRARITLLDRSSGTTIEGEIADLDLRRRGTAVTGAADGRLTLGGAALAMRLNAELDADGGTHWEASLLPLSTRPIETDRLDPALAAFGTLDATLEAHGTLDLSPALRPQRGALRLALGAGTLAVPNSQPLVFDRVSAHAAASWVDGSWTPASVRLEPVEAVVVGRSGRRTAARMTGEAVRADGRWTVQTALGFDQAEFTDLPSIWPAAWGGHVRPWLTENVTAGLAHDAAFTATLEAPAADLSQLQVTAAGGTMAADAVVIHWLRPVPPIERAQALLTVTGPDDLVITIPRGQQGPLTLTDGVLRFTGLSHKDQYLALTATASGSVPDLLKLLREPRLRLLDAHPLPITGSAGRVTGSLAVNVPMFDHLTFDQVTLGSKGRLTGLRLNGLVAGRDLTNGTIAYAVTQDGLTASGTATVAGVAGRADVGMDFRTGPPEEVTQQARLVGRIGPAELAAQGIDATGVLAGAALVDVTYREQRNGQAEVAVQADLAPAELSLAGWHKAAGAPAQAAATVSLLHGTVAGVPQLTASGPDLAIVASAEMLDGAPRVLRVPTVVLGPTRLSGEVVFPAEPGEALRVRATGPVLDLADQLKQVGGPGGSGGMGTRSVVADVRFGRVMLGEGRALTELAAHLELANGQIRALQATTTGVEQLRASVTPVPGGRRLIVQAADTGSLLRGLNLTNTIGGGALAVDASFDDRTADPALSGQLRLQQFSVHDEVVLGKLLQAATLYGVVDALRGRGVYFAEAQLPFTYGGKVLRLGPSRMSSPSLGITAKGSIDLGRHVLDLTGTVVPAYVLNAALGRLPLIGPLFSAERDGGLLAAGFTVTGPLGNPGVNVNPLSLLTPGALRNLFN